MNTSQKRTPCGYDDSEPVRLITTRELARRLGVTSNTIRKWTREGRIPCLRIGQKTLRFNAAAVIKVLSHSQADRTEGGDA